MNPQNETKRKYAGITTFKPNLQMGPLISTKQRKKTEVSREKDDRKIMMTQERNTHKILNNLPVDHAKANTKIINFRNLKDTKPHREIMQTKTQLRVAKTHTEYLSKNNNGKSQIPANEASHGISINVNIQNMMPKQNQNFPKNGNTMFNEEKKKSKASTIMKFQEFECNEQLTFKRRPLEPKPKLQEKNIDKMPLIDRKQHQRIEKPPNKPKNTLLQQLQVIKKLEAEAATINQAAQNQAMMFLDEKQQEYHVPPDYIQKCQPNLTWMMRVILFEWMMHVSYQFAMKRQTFHLAVYIVDYFMSKEHNLAKSQFQLIGAAAMFIASKLEEFEAKCSQEFAESTKGRYSAKQIKEMQLRICRTLKYRLNPPTINMWANRFMLQWDSYLQNSQYARIHPLFASCQLCYFKRCQQKSLRLFRQLMQYLDCAVLHIHTMHYKPKLLVFAFMYLVLGKEFQFFNANRIAHEFPGKSDYLLDQQSLFNDLFMSFLEQSFGIILLDLLPTIQYAASYFILSLDFSNPIPAKIQDIEKNLTLEEFCSYQTHNPNLTIAIKHRNNNLR